MKFVILFLLICESLMGIAQKTVLAQSNAAKVKSECRAGANDLKLKVLWFVDSLLVTDDVVMKLNTNDIQNVSILKHIYDSITNSEGKIYIELKKGKCIKLFDFASFKLKYVSNPTKPILLMLNSVFIKDYTNFVIDEKTIAKVEIDKGADIEPIKNIYPNNCIVNILTSESFNRNSVSQVLLNGAALSK
jgi:hypothetical protein